MALGNGHGPARNPERSRHHFSRPQKVGLLLLAGGPALPGHGLRVQRGPLPQVGLVQGPAQLGHVEPRLRHVQAHGQHLGPGFGRHDPAVQVGHQPAVGGPGIGHQHRDLPGGHPGPRARAQQVGQGPAGPLPAAHLVDVGGGVVPHQHIGTVHHAAGEIGVEVQGAHHRNVRPDYLARPGQQLPGHVRVARGRQGPVQGEEHPVDPGLLQGSCHPVHQLFQPLVFQQAAGPGLRPDQADPFHLFTQNSGQAGKAGQLAHIAVPVHHVGAALQAVEFELGPPGRLGIEGVGLLQDLSDGNPFHRGSFRLDLADIQAA